MSCPFESLSRGFVRVSGRKNGGGASRAARWWGWGQQRERQEEEMEGMEGRTGGSYLCAAPAPCSTDGGSSSKGRPSCCPYPRCSIWQREGGSSSKKRCSVESGTASCSARLCRHVRGHEHACTYTHMRVVACTREHAHTCVQTQTACSHGCTDLCVNASTLTCECKHICTHTYMFTRVSPWLLGFCLHAEHSGLVRVQQHWIRAPGVGGHRVRRPACFASPAAAQGGS